MKINKYNYKFFQTIYLKKSNNDVCLADAFSGCGVWINLQDNRRCTVTRSVVFELKKRERERDGVMIWCSHGRKC
jgi:hypothetical protein